MLQSFGFKGKQAWEHQQVSFSFTSNYHQQDILHLLWRSVVKSIFFGVNLKQQLNRLNPLWGWKNAWHLGVDVESVDVSEEYQWDAPGKKVWRKSPWKSNAASNGKSKETTWDNHRTKWRLVSGATCRSWKMMEFVTGVGMTSHRILKIINVWNHQRGGL